MLKRPENDDAPAPIEEDPTPGITGDDEVDDEEDELSEKSRKHLVVAFAVLLATTLDRIGTLTDHLADGLDLDLWAKHFRDELTAAHSEAAMIGRKLSGDAKAVHADDIKAGQAAWQAQETYFAAFLLEIRAGKYGQPGEDLNEKGFGNRALSYGKAIRGTVHDAFKAGMGEEPLTWNLGDAVHCGPNEDFPYDCPSLSEMSPLPASQWPTVPVGCDCECLFNCKCYFTSGTGHSTQGI
jgi:hypothetical protein